LTIGAAAVGKHTITSTGLLTVTDGSGSALAVVDDATLAAVIQYLAANDIGDAGATVVLQATYASTTRGGTAHSIIYTQTATTAGGSGGYNVVDVVGVTLVGVEATASTTNLSAYIA
jgi:hypothetical protein